MFFFMVEYPDPVEGRVLTKEFYVGTRTSPIYNWSGGKSEMGRTLKMKFYRKVGDICVRCKR